ncbi:MAG: tRNA (adenosine(37)-N6)-threonylcarbamoyltransferase complex dimerization subunit type 1 TsaB [Phycisphaerae bacterium]|nr:tRNA (adenosine(37)-N6)-threonylcarbamoyltransferase complex dimerization subunit type 1 TsaB [Phycisphaerae bacterium]
MSEVISIAIETSCRAGGVALGRGGKLLACRDFDTSARHATQLVSRLKALLDEAGLKANDPREVYISAGPGSFTGLRVGITVARTLGQMVAGLRCVAVPTAAAVAENARELSWQHLGVVMDAKDDHAYSCLFTRRGDEIVQASGPAVLPVQQFIQNAPRPLLLIGEALAYHEPVGEGLSIADESLHLPKAEGVWCVGRRLARRGQFVDYHRLLPIYAREPEALRLWRRRQGRNTR